MTSEESIQTHAELNAIQVSTTALAQISDSDAHLRVVRYLVAKFKINTDYLGRH